jgi:hypothetical protein
MKTDKKFTLLFFTFVFCGSAFIFTTKDNAFASQPKETVLEDPYKSARQNETKYIDLSDNLSDIYRKSYIIADNFNIKRIIGFFKKIVAIIKDFLVKINLLKS